MPRTAPSAPPKRMTWGKALPILALALVFDALRFMFEQFWFFGPALLGFATDAALGGGVIGKAGAVVAAGLAGFFGSGAFEVFGLVMAIAIGLAGWMTVCLVIILTNARLIKEHAGSTLWLMGSLFVSEVPLLGTLPALTVTMARLYSAQIKRDREAKRTYEKQAASSKQAALRRSQNAQLRTFQAQQAANAETYEEFERVA